MGASLSDPSFWMRNCSFRDTTALHLTTQTPPSFTRTRTRNAHVFMLGPRNGLTPRETPQYVEGSIGNHHIRPFPGSTMVGCAGVTRPFSDPRPIQTLLTSLKRTMECHTYVHQNILYDNPNEEDSLYLLTNGTSSASCDKIVY